MKRKLIKDKYCKRTKIANSILGITVLLPPELSLPDWIMDSEFYSFIEGVLKSKSIQSKEKIDVTSNEDSNQALIKAISSIATNAWRAKNKMVDADSGEAREEMKRVFRHNESIIETLKQIGVETIDPSGRAYHSGMALKVIIFEPTPGLTREEIKETIKPSILWQGRLIQIGEVIIGTPQTE